MKKSLIALAALAATSAFAQSSVTIWGVADAGIQSVSQGGVSKTQLSSSGLSSSQLGFKGTEDIGGGLKASFWLEAGMTMDAPNAFSFGRRQTVDLAGNFGAIRMGRDYTPSFWNHTVFDPYGTLGSGAGSNITLNAFNGNGTTGARTSNGVSYLYNVAANGGSHALGSQGVYAQVTYALAENLSTVAAKTNQYTGARVGYAAGALNVAVATAETITGVTTKDTVTNLGASYDLGVAKLMGLTVSTKIGATNTTYTATQVGATIPLGNGYIPVSYATGKNDKNSMSGDQFAIGYVYNLSPRTALYTTYSAINNKNGAAYAYVGGNGGFVGVTNGLTAAGNGTAYDIGLRHSF
jgi:predicted porin